MKNCKVYNDGSHFIAIRHKDGYSGVRRKLPAEEPIIVEEDDKEPTVGEISVQCDEHADTAETNDEQVEKPPGHSYVSTKADEFIKWYRQSLEMSKREQYDFIASKLEPYFDDKDKLYSYLNRKLSCRKRAEIVRYQRCFRRAALHRLNYFCTFTYDDKKVTEEDFKSKLLTALSNLAKRKEWKYMGAWERGGDTSRLHFHAVAYIPEDKMVGQIEHRRQYDVKKKEMVEWEENSYFGERFGRNSFEVIDGSALSLNTAVGYITKYIEKDGGRIICSKGLKTFIETDISNEDIIARLRSDDDTKYILHSDFNVYRDGKKLGTVSQEVLAKAKLVN